MKKTGGLLKKTREEKQLSIHEIGLSLKINSKILKAIEEGDAANLPAKTFLRGFVQSYAQYLKLNQDEVLKLFTEEMGTTKPQALPITIGTDSSQVVTPSGQTKPTSKNTSPVAQEEASVTITSGKQFKNVTLVASLIVLITLILITKRIIDRYQNEAATNHGTALAPNGIAEPTTTSVSPITPTLPDGATTKEASAPIAAPAQTQNTASTTTLTPTPAPSQVAPPSPPSSTFVNSASTGPTPRSALPQNPVVTKTSPAPSTVVPPVPAPTAGTPSTPTSVPAVAAAPTPATKSAPPPQQPKETTSNTNATVPTPTATTETKPQPEIKPAIKSVELIIEALDAVDIEYSTATGKNEKMRLEPEQLHTIKTKSGLKLNVSNGGAINIIVNGKDVGVPGVLGKPIKLTY